MAKLVAFVVDGLLIIDGVVAVVVARFEVVVAVLFDASVDFFIIDEVEFEVAGQLQHFVI
jgi:hypothetical protein